MHYQKYKPGNLLEPYVECYYSWNHAEVFDAPFETESPPSGYTAMVFNFGDTYEVCIEEDNWEQTPPTFITGQSTRTYSLRMKGKLNIVGVVFKPATLYDFYHLDMEQLVNSRVNAEYLLGDKARKIHTELSRITEPEARISLLESHLINDLETANPAWDEVNDAVEQILEKKGNISLKDLYEKYHISTRQFQRNFRKKVGLSPKNYVRIKRFSYICYLLVNQKKIDWQEVIYLGGYYDQSHFIKDFLSYMDENPSYYYETHQELARLLK